MKRCIALLLVFCTLISGQLSMLCAGADGTEYVDSEKYPVLSEYLFEVISTDSLLLAADEAVCDGKDPQQVLDEAFALAEEYGISDKLGYLIENISAEENDAYNRINKYFSDLDVNSTNYYLWGADYIADESDSDFSPYDSRSVSEAFAAVISDDGAQYCLSPYVWPEEGFNEVFGVPYASFRPAAARPGYVCVVAKNGAKSGPDEPWNGDDSYDFTNSLNELISALSAYLGNDAPVFTGNPQLASEFWVYDIQYPFYALYGSDGAVKGYNCTATLTVVDAAAKNTLASITGTEILGDTISSWHDWKALADPPALGENAGFESFAGTVRLALQKSRSEAASQRKITGYNAESVLNGILLSESESMYDNWQKAIFEAGAENVSLEDGVLSFCMRSFDPDTASIGAYADAADKSAWLTAALENASAYGLEASVQLKDGRPDSQSLYTLKNTALQAGYKAQQAFSGADMQAALKEHLFPAKGDDFTAFADSNELLADYTADAWAALFSGQASQSISVSGGPHAIALSFVGISPSELLEHAMKAALDSQAYAAAEDRTADLDALFAEKLAEASESLAKTVYYDANNTHRTEIDIDAILKGEYPLGYAEYLDGYDYSEYYDVLLEMCERLPEQAAIDPPPSGKITGSGHGITVGLQVSSGSENTYIQVCDALTDELTASAFVRSGNTVYVFVPAGEYCLVYGSGPYWYGFEDNLLFAGLGSYTKSESFDISMPVSFTLEPSDKGDVDIYGADRSDFVTDPA